MGDQPLSPAALGILAERLGPLPLINHFLSRMGLLEVLEQHVPTTDRRSAVTVDENSAIDDRHDSSLDFHATEIA